MKTNKVYTGFDYAYTKKHPDQWKKYKTNELDEILKKYAEGVIQSLAMAKTDLSEGIDKACISHGEAKQQINKWALEKCLRVIGENSKHNVPFTVIENMVLESLRERARKEFE